MTRVWLWWSGGKDSAWAHAVLARKPGVRVAGLVTTLGEDGRVAAHGVPRELVDAQAESLALPVHYVELPQPCSNADYEAAFAGVVRRAEGSFVDAMAFGDLYLEDVRDYRIGLLADTPIAPLFPLWGLDTLELSRTLVESGLRATVVSLDPERLDEGLLGRRYDRAFLEDLPAGVDACGERGEFHTFVSLAPGFSSPVGHGLGERYERDGALRIELLPAAAGTRPPAL